jgi:hypothetical protein
MNKLSLLFEVYPSGYLRLRTNLFMSQTRNLASMLQQMFDNVPGFSYQDKLNYLANCKCCVRHQINKPIVFVPWHETPVNNSQQFIYPCMCNCRHVARHICRQVDSQPPTLANSPTNIIDL